MGNGKSKPQLFVPMCLGLVKKLPVKGPFSEIDAMYSLEVDNFNGNPVTVMGCAKRWRWSRNKVRNFFERINAEIAYPGDTKKTQNQAGLLRQKRTDKGPDKGQIIFIDIKELQSKKDRKRTDKGPLLRKSKDIRVKDSAKSDPKVTVFRNWFCNLYKEKFAREYVLSKSHYGKVGAQIKNLLGLDGLTFEELQYMAIEFIKDEDAYLEDAGYNFGNLLARAQQNKYQGYLNVQFKESFERFIVNEDGTHKYNAT